MYATLKEEIATNIEGDGDAFGFTVSFESPFDRIRIYFGVMNLLWLDFTVPSRDGFDDI